MAVRCKICGDPNLIHSGVDAFLFGVPTEVYCLPCVLANPELGTPIARTTTSAELRSTTLLR